MLEFKFWKTFWKDDPFWKQRAAKAILLDFALASFFLSLSTFDVGGDSNLAYSYLKGTNYTQLVNNSNDLLVENCTLVKNITCQEEGNAKKYTCYLAHSNS